MLSDTHEGDHEKKDRKKVTSFNCHRYGHYTSACHNSNNEDETTYPAEREENA